MFITNNKAGQNPLTQRKARAMNRTGGTLVVGDVVAFDFDASDAATQAKTGIGGVTRNTLAEAAWENLVLVAAARNQVVAVVTSLLLGAGADDTEVEVQVFGQVRAKVGGTNWAAGYSSCGVKVMADTTGSNKRLVVAADGAQGVNGFINEAIDTDLSASNQLATVEFNGFGSFAGSLGA